MSYARTAWDFVRSGEGVAFMEKRDAKTIEVRAGWLEGNPLIGLLRTERGWDGKERSTFSHDAESRTRLWGV